MEGGGRMARSARATAIEVEHRPALDGIRALAVAAVVLFHLDHLSGGNLGVDAFFVLSGWLITTRLLAGAAGAPGGRIDLREFWAGRVRRLAPASLAVLLAVPLAWRLGGIGVASLRRDVTWALGWASNWGTITGGGDYWARFGEPSPITHFWSLAVEEQLYLVWPLVLYVIVRVAAGRRDAVVGAVSLALAAGSVAYMVSTFDAADPTATYLNTLARAHSLLLGAAAAALTAPPARRVVVSRAARIAAPVAVAVVAAIVLAGSDSARWLFVWGFPLFAVSMAVVVVAAADGWGSRLLASRGLRWVGDRSYGIYLWHWPAILYLRGDRAPLEGIPLDLLRVLLAVALAAASYRWLEMPIRRRAWSIQWGPALAIGAVVAVAAVALVPRATTPPAQVEAIVVLPPAVPSAKTTPLPTGQSLSALPTDPAEALPSDPAATGVPVRVLVVGDSTAIRLADGLLPYAAAHPDQIVAGSAAYVGCGLSVATDGRMHAFTKEDGREEVIDLRGCTQGWNQILERVRSGVEAVDVVLVDIGPWDGVDIHLTDGRVVSVIDPVGRRMVAGAYRQFVTDVEAAGPRVVWVTPADLHLAWRGTPSPIDDPRRWEALRAIVDALPVEQIDLPSWLHRNDLDGPEGRPDGVHLTREANARFVETNVVPFLLRLPPEQPTAAVPPPAEETPGVPLLVCTDLDLSLLGATIAPACL
ncbi:MAG: acyltransferase family protein [Microthrixaceae bacterium]